MECGGKALASSEITNSKGKNIMSAIPSAIVYLTLGTFSPSSTSVWVSGKAGCDRKRMRTRKRKRKQEMKPEVKQEVMGNCIIAHLSVYFTSLFLMLERKIDIEEPK